MSEKSTTVMKRRLNIVIACALLVFVGWIVFNLIRIAIIESETYLKLANSQQFKTTVIHANRGTIYDRNGQVLAKSATVYTIYVDPRTLNKYDSEKLDIIVETLSEILEVDKETVLTKCQASNAYQEIKRNVEKTTADKIIQFIKDEELSCLGATPTSKRAYPQNDLAANVIGHVHYDGYGIYGLESYYDSYLAGVDGKIITATDAQGNEIFYEYKQNYDAQDGNSLILNLDLQIQYYLEKALKKSVDTYSATNRGCGIIMNAKTGQILAMATEPDYDLNNPTAIFDPKVEEYLAALSGEEYNAELSAAWSKQWSNKAVSELYYPGSVFKVVTGSAALEEKVIAVSDQYHCNGSITVKGQKFRCWTAAGHGTQNFLSAMANSCNPAFITIGQKLGVDLFSRYFLAFGLNEKTGIDLPGELSSLYISGDKMSLVDLASSSFGQANKITPIEMITAYAAVVNGGYLVTPYVVDKVLDANGNVIKTNKPVIKRQVISEETSAIMRDTLEYVVTAKNGSNAYIKGYQIGGKSGTSQKIDEDPSGHTYVASYVGFAPADDPEIIVLVMIDDPSGGTYYGGTVAAPVVSEIFSNILPYLGYFAEYTDEELEKMEINIPSLEGYEVSRAKETLTNLGLKFEVVGNGNTVIKQTPGKGNAVPRGSKIILYTEEGLKEEYVTVPDVSGMTLSQANKAITDKGLIFKPLGGAAYNSGAKASVQNYSEVKVRKGTIIEVYFYVNDETG